MKSSFYFLIIMNGLSCFTWQSHAAQMIRVTELQGHPNSQAQSEIQENILQPVLTNPLNLSFTTPPIFPLVIIISNLSPTHPTSCFEKSHHSVIFLAQ